MHPYTRPKPDGRVGHGLVYDSVRERVVLFGGIILALAAPEEASPTDSVELDDVWEYEVVGDVWSGPMLPTERPLRRHLHAMAYDISREAVVLHGGRSILDNVIHPDTWEWRGPDDATAGQWERVLPVGEELLLPRWGHALAFDSSRDRLVLFGGTGWQATAGAPAEAMRPYEYSDVWEYGSGPFGLAWVERSPGLLAVQPRGRWGHSLTGIPSCVSEQCILMFGGNALAEPQSDLWLWNGSAQQWSEVQPVGDVSPRARFGHAFYLDEGRGRFVLFGGAGRAPAGSAWWYTIDTMNDTWDLDPSDWSWIENTPKYGRFTTPSNRVFGRMVWDARRNRGDLFGGLDMGCCDFKRVGDPFGFVTVQSTQVLSPAYPSDTWHYRFPGWTSYESRPPRRVNSAIAFDGAAGRLLLFGGDEELEGAAWDPNYAEETVTGDTWVWDGRSDERNWTEYGMSPRKPRARWDHALAFDPVRERVVLFGGQGRLGEIFGDTWAWEGAAFEWSPIPGGVPARRGHAMAWDPLTRSVLLFGGRSERQVFSDTWRWDGGARRWWPVERQPEAPLGRIRHGLATDLERDRVVMFGGVDAGGAYYFGDTWEWDGGEGRWFEVAPIGAAPRPRRSHAMTYDPARGAVILFGGWTGKLEEDLWEWNGARASWTDLTCQPVCPPAHLRPAVMDAVMAFDPSLGSSVLFSGRVEADPNQYPPITRANVTWTFPSPANLRPALEPIGPRTVRTGELLAVDLVAHDDEPISYSALELPEGATLDQATGRFQWVPRDDQARRHAMTFSASDGCATDSERVEIRVCLRNCPPLLHPIGPQNVLAGIPFALQLAATDEESDALTFSSSALPDSAALDPDSGLFEWTATADQVGEHAIRFAVSDGYATDAEVVRFIVCDGNCPPVLDLIGDQAVPVGGLLDLTVTATDVDDDDLAFEVPERPAGAGFDPLLQRFQWTPGPGQVGWHAATFRVSDGALTDEETIRILVCKSNCPPVFAPMEDHTVAEGDVLSFMVSAHDANGDTMDYQVEALPKGATFDAGAARFTWTPDFDQGGASYPVTFWASDGRAETVMVAHIDVLDVIRPPVIGPMDRIVAIVGEPLVVDVPVMDPDGYPVALEPVNRPPAGSRFEGLQFLWTPGPEQIGQHPPIPFRVVELGSEPLSVQGQLVVEVVGDSDSFQHSGEQEGCGCGHVGSAAMRLGWSAMVLAALRRRRVGGRA